MCSDRKRGLDRAEGACTLDFHGSRGCGNSLGGMTVNDDRARGWTQDPFLGPLHKFEI